MASKCRATDLVSIANKAKQQVTVAKAKKWQTQYDHEHQSFPWLKYDIDDQDTMLVKVLRCSACTNFDSSIHRIKNYSSAWIIG